MADALTELLKLSSAVVAGDLRGSSWGSGQQRARPKPSKSRRRLLPPWSSVVRAAPLLLLEMLGKTPSSPSSPTWTRFGHGGLSLELVSSHEIFSASDCMGSCQCFLLDSCFMSSSCFAALEGRSEWVCTRRSMPTSIMFSIPRTDAELYVIVSEGSSRPNGRTSFSALCFTRMPFIRRRLVCWELDLMPLHSQSPGLSSISS